MATIGFIGTGNIGNPMARHLLEAGHQLVVFDLNPAATENLSERGAQRVESAREVAAACRVVFTSLPGPKEVEDTVRGADGLLAGAKAGDIHVDLSTNSVTAVKRMAETEAGAGVLYLDSPVTGGVAGAEAGTLTLLVSGDQLAYERAEPFMRAIGTNIFYLGETGSGTLVKLINNLIVLCAGQLMQEGLVMGAKAGLDPEKLADMLRLSTARPYIGLMPQVIGRRFDNPTFSLALAAKDVGLALETARDLAVPMPVTSAAHQTYLRALAAGLGAKSFLATLEALEAAANTVVPKVDIARGTDRV